MDVILYRLRDAGRPLTYAEVKVQPRLSGRLVLGTWGTPEVHARLLDAGDPMAVPQLSHARVTRISAGCIVMMGFEPGAYLPLPRQTWLCALDEGAGEAALRKIRPPE